MAGRRIEKGYGGNIVPRIIDNRVRVPGKSAFCLPSFHQSINSTVSFIPYLSYHLRMVPRILQSLLGCCLVLPLAVTVTAIHGQRRPSWSNGRRVGSHHDVDRNSIFATTTTSLLDVNYDTHSLPMGQTNVVPIHQTITRGGACSDSTPRLFAKIAFGAAVETSLMYALVDLIVTLKSNNNQNGNSPAIAIFQTIVLLSIIFGSSTFGSIVDSGLSAATKQILDPNQIPVSVCREYVYIVILCIY